MQPEFIDTAAAAKLTGISQSTLEKWRCAGTGFPYIKVGRCVKYALGDVRAWMNAHRVMSTSQYLAVISDPAPHNE